MLFAVCFLFGFRNNIFIACSSHKNGCIVGSTKASFLGGKKLKLRKYVAPAGTRSVSVSAAAADPDRPLWFPGSTPPPWLDGRFTTDSILFSLYLLTYSYPKLQRSLFESCFACSLPGDFGFDPLGLGTI